MSLKLYYDFLSQPSRALYIFLKLAKIPFEGHIVNLRKGEHVTAEFKQNYSKFQKVPFIHHTDVKLTESVAILRYLAREFPLDDHWYPKDSKLQAKADEFLEWQHFNIRLAGLTYFRMKYMIPLKTGNNPPEKDVENSKTNLLKALDDFERLFLTENPFIIGDRISYADIQAACEIEQPKFGGLDPRHNYPKIKAWIENVKKECNPYYEEAHELVNQVANDLKKDLQRNSL